MCFEFRSGKLQFTTLGVFLEGKKRGTYFFAVLTQIENGTS